MQWFWRTNEHSLRVTVHDWDGKRVMLTVDGVEECFSSRPNCSHWTATQNALRIVPDFDVVNSFGTSYSRIHSLM